MKNRLDSIITKLGLVPSRSQAVNLIKLGKVKVNQSIITKPGHLVSDNDEIRLLSTDMYVSRAGLKLASVASQLGLDFRGKTVLDVGSSTGGFTDYALQNGANKVIAVDVGTDQLHPKLRGDKRVELHEKTDIRHFSTDQQIDVVLIDVSFISLRQILPSVNTLTNKNCEIVAMVKPQFEAGKEQTNKGVVKNDSIRRQILKDFEIWLQDKYKILNKFDSDVAGVKGNVERFYLLKKRI